MDPARLTEAHFRLGRMHVHVDRFRRYIEKQHDGRVAVKVEGIAGAIRGVGEDAILHQASVDEEELIAAAAES